MENPTQTEAKTPDDDTVRGSNQSGMRLHNERLVLTLIRQMGPLAKSEIARLTGLSAQTVSVIMRSLEADGLLHKGPPVRGKVGQPSVPMGLSGDGAYFLGLKVGRRSADLILTDFLGNLCKRITKTYQYPDPADVVNFANEAIAELIGTMPAGHRNRVAGLGIAIPFRLWEWTDALGVAQHEMDAWRDADIRAQIAASWDFPVLLGNDASSACSAELVFGDKDKPSEFLYFFVGFFIGGGIVLNNNLFTGKSGNAGGLGPIPIDRDGARVTQLMDVASLSTLENAVIAQGGDAAMIWNTPHAWSVPDAILDDWITRAADGLAFSILTSLSLIEFECVIIDGWMPETVRDRLVQATRTAMEAIEIPGIKTPDVRIGSIGSDARALGAVSLPLSERFLVDQTAFLKASP